MNDELTKEQLEKVAAMYRIRCLKVGDNIEQTHLDDIKLLIGENPKSSILMEMNLHGDGTLEVTTGAELLKGQRQYGR